MAIQVSGFSLDTVEYERKRNIFEMCRWVNEKLSLMEKEKDFYTAYFEKEKKRYENVKAFLDEAVPVACLGLYLFKPGDNVYVRCFADTRPCEDAKIRVKGFNNFIIKVEVTTIETEDSMLRRLAVSKHGFTWGSGTIKRDGENIVQEPECVDFSEQNDKLAALAFERMAHKLEKLAEIKKTKNVDIKNTAILVYLDTSLYVYGDLPLEDRAALIRKTQEHLHKEKIEIYGVYYCYAQKFIVDGIRFDDLI